MARIYISSTMIDLDAHRAAVINGLRKLRQDVVAAEDYVAGEQRPLDRCVADVRTCDIYVGIFAWRYGFIPPGSDISITEAEYRTAASEDGVTPLIFLLNEDAPWPPRMIDAVTGNGDAGARIAGLKKRLKEHHIVSFFASPDQLANLVLVSVSAKILQPQLTESLGLSWPATAVDVTRILESGGDAIRLGSGPARSGRMELGVTVRGSGTGIVEL